MKHRESDFGNKRPNLPLVGSLGAVTIHAQLLVCLYTLLVPQKIIIYNILRYKIKRNETTLNEQILKKQGKMLITTVRHFPNHEIHRANLNKQFAIAYHFVLKRLANTCFHVPFAF